MVSNTHKTFYFGSQEQEFFTFVQELQSGSRAKFGKISLLHDRDSFVYNKGIKFIRQ